MFDSDPHIGPFLFNCFSTIYHGRYWLCFFTFSDVFFCIGFREIAILNSYLSSKWSWITQTKSASLVMGVIGTVLYTVPVVLGINYFQFVMYYRDQDPANFFTGIHDFHAFILDFICLCHFNIFSCREVLCRIGKQQ